MKGLRSIVDNEKGSPLVIVLLILVLLTLIGMSVMNTSSTDVQMAGQHRRYKMTFYGADGGTEIACELLEQNLSCPVGFSDNTGGNGAVIGVDPVPGWPFPCPDDLNVMQGVLVNDLDFAKEIGIAAPTTLAASDFFYPANMNAACPWPHSLLSVGELGTGLGAGGSALDNAGYEGLGLSAANGGGEKVYQIFSRRIETNDDVTVTVRWRHIMGQVGDCNY